MRFALLRPLAACALLALAPAGSWSATRPAPPREINSLATEMSPRISLCLIRREPALIDRWLGTLPGSAEESRLFRGAEPRFPPCFRQAHGFNGGVWIPKYDKAGIRAALVRALLQARRDDLPAAAPAGGPSTWYPSLSAESRTRATAEHGAAVAAAELAACLAGKHWPEVLAIVRAVDPKAEASIAWGYRETKAAREREAAAVESALSRVIPSLPGCVPAGARLRIDRPRLRSLLEEAALQTMKQEAPAKASAYKVR